MQQSSMLTDGGEVKVQESRSQIETHKKKEGRDRDHKDNRKTVGVVLLRTLDSGAVICVL